MCAIQVNIMKRTMMNAIHVECLCLGQDTLQEDPFKRCSLASCFCWREEVLLHQDLNGTD